MEANTQARMDLPGTLEALDANNRQMLDAAKALNLTPTEAMKLARPRNRFPHISRIRNSARGQNSLGQATRRLADLSGDSELDRARRRLDRLVRSR
jgi:hypothetical protein